MGCHGPHLLQGELDASRPYLGGCRLKPLDHKDLGVCPIFTLALSLTSRPYPPSGRRKPPVVSSGCSTPVGALSPCPGRDGSGAGKRQER
ncbi:hypothetical protein SFR_6046 [Streptomyces sp. FR-008]|nr:hypothetical protein SFR_6046 [Streptomyces sp. FR-008]